MSTSLIQCTVMWGSAVLVQTSFSWLTFQLWSSTSESGYLGLSIVPLWEQVPPVWFNIPSFYLNGVKESTYSTISFSFHSLPCSSGSTKPQLLRGWCQIHWIVEDCNTRTIQCITRQSRIATKQGSGTEKYQFDLEPWVAPELLPDSGS